MRATPLKDLEQFDINGDQQRSSGSRMSTHTKPKSRSMVRAMEEDDKTSQKVNRRSQKSLENLGNKDSQESLRVPRNQSVMSIESHQTERLFNVGVESKRGEELDDYPIDWVDLDKLHATKSYVKGTNA